MTTPTINTSASYLKNFFFADNAETRCNDDTISYYRSMDQPFTWEIFNIGAFLSSYNNDTYEVLQATPNSINIFLINLLKTLNTIVYDTYSESLFKNKFHQHLKKFIELVYISDVRPSADDAIQYLCKKCNELYGWHTSPHTTVKTHIYLTYDVDHERDCIGMEVTLTDQVTKKVTILTFNFYL